MVFTQFIDLPAQLKIQIINKCSPISYVRLRQTCRFADEFCEKYRKQLAVYCRKDEFTTILWRENKDKQPFYVGLEGRNKSVRFYQTPDNMAEINKALSGFLFADMWLGIIRENYDNALNYFLEAAPDFKVTFLECHGMTAKQIERVVESKWKIGGMKIDCKLDVEMSKILQIDAVRKMDPLHCEWNKRDNEFTEEDIVQLTRGKTQMSLYPQFLSPISTINALKTIAKSWKSGGHFPKWFRMRWRYERNDMSNIMEANISGLYSEIMAQEACHLGSFLKPNFSIVPMERINDIWIRKDEANWQFVTIERTKVEGQGALAFFQFEAMKSATDFVQKMTAVLYETFGVIIDESFLYEACVTENMEKIKEAFVNMVPKQQK